MEVCQNLIFFVYQIETELNLSFIDWICNFTNEQKKNIKILFLLKSLKCDTTFCKFKLYYIVPFKMFLLQ